MSVGFTELFFTFYLLFLAARRANGKISLEDVLKFVTGCNYEPVLGFRGSPVFVLTRKCHPAYR